MTNFQQRRAALRDSFIPKKATELYYVRHPKVDRALLGPFLNQADAECGRVVLRSPDAVVTSCLVESLDKLTYWHAVNNGQVCRAFAGAEGVSHE
ncbi:hypothetical protein N5D79_18440 [Pseudomonas sp. GD03817]|uniref:Uncharacterized protein n=1 Tax=Pseudomonas monteilii TaxID=76759 RepID=A0A399MEG8_9PSED|nr:MULTISPECIES: hypothetical protein [Pseudomonas]ANC79604.1 hypothetical protein KKK_00615 [Pseudomonas putida B6-2]MDH1404381.1 hypothetical protein [Pseudomonas sp. GD03730]MDH1776858.1 hypothetical protein [Pseudomonas sp. GD03817]RII80232.1 hypothetical protein D0894_01260 [Pseudomonas monteilii]